MHFQNFNSDISGKTTHYPSLVENDNAGKLVLNLHYQCLLPISIQDTKFSLEAFYEYLTMSLLYKKVLKMLPKINIV